MLAEYRQPEQDDKISSPRRNRKAEDPAKGEAELRGWTMETARNLLKSIGEDSRPEAIQASWERVQDAKDCGKASRYNFPRLTKLPF